MMVLDWCMKKGQQCSLLVEASWSWQRHTLWGKTDCAEGPWHVYGSFLSLTAAGVSMAGAVASHGER